MDIITVDFETDAIVGNPVITPPRSVGAAVWAPEQEPVYLAWRHPSENNCTFGDAHEYFRRLRESGLPLLFHNAPFDVSVWDADFCNAKLNVALNQNWRRIHDTVFLLFLDDPYSSTLSLKPSANRYLGMAPAEQDDLHKYILSHFSEATPKTAGAFIGRCPGELVAPYAIGDVVRTRKLFDLLYRSILERGMEGAYDRERRLVPTLIDGTRRGIRLNREQLEQDERDYSRDLHSADEILARRLGCPVSHLEHDESLADALENAGAVTEWVYTPKSKKRSMSKDNLKVVIPEVKVLMEYRSGISTCLQTFMRPWLEFSRADGRVHPEWNQVRSYEKGNPIGTRTGRLSSSGPNFQNVPTEFVDNLGHPLPVPAGLLPFPFMRRYCLPEKGHVWAKRDFSSQEIRILAHFEDGSLCEAYRANPGLDPHQMAVELIAALIGITYARKDVKITGFSIIYGTGATGLSIQLGTDRSSAFTIKEAYLDAMPGVRMLMQDVQRRGRSNLPIRTWGGRIYYSEPAKEVDGQLRDFSYKLLNYLIQGSAADQTKEAICDWNDERKWDEYFLATVHDEINISVPKETWYEGMSRLKNCMNKDRFDVPMLSDGFVGENWEDIIDELEFEQRANVGTVPAQMEVPIQRQA